MANESDTERPIAADLHPIETGNYRIPTPAIELVASGTIVRQLAGSGWSASNEAIRCFGAPRSVSM